ncbi:MAG: hypothetical protein KatS3mg056_4043 [Chloroflexus sp.]|nr:MAG: hypothetical protein KatS3mg056_4043 [Chloroflexus sp.]
MQRMNILLRAGGPRSQRPGMAGHLPVTPPASVSPHLSSLNFLSLISYLLIFYLLSSISYLLPPISYLLPPPPTPPAVAQLLSP